MENIGMKHNESAAAGPEGRASGAADDGRFEYTSKFPKLTICFPPSAKARLDTIGVLSKQPAWRILDRALLEYVRTLAPQDQALINAVVLRMEEKEREKDQADVNAAPRAAAASA
jgi:hypothetical protein